MWMVAQTAATCVSVIIVAATGTALSARVMKGEVDTGKRTGTLTCTILSCSVHTARYAASMCMHQPAAMYNILFDAVWDTVNCFGKDAKWLGAQRYRMIAILHTWGQTMTLHPHLHCIVPGGGLTKQHKWRTAKSDGKYLFNVKAMSNVFRGKFIAQLKKRLPSHATPDLLNSLYKQPWVVFAKKPFHSPHKCVKNIRALHP